MISLGSSVATIGLAIRLHDHFTANAQRIQGSMNQLDMKARRLRERNYRDMRQVGFNMMAAGLTAGYGISYLMKTGAEFEWLMKGVQAISEIPPRQMEVMKRKIIELSKTTVYSAKEIGSAAERMAKAGYGASDIIGTIKAVTDLGAATDTTIHGPNGAAEMMIHMMNSFQMTADQSRYMADVLAMVTNRATLDISDLHESLKYLGSTATGLKIPFEEAAAMMGVLSNAGMKGGMAGRGMNNALLYLTKTMTDLRTGRQAQVLKALNLNPQEFRKANGELKSMGDILGVLLRATDNLPNPERVAFLQALFNIRGQRSIEPLLRQMKFGRGYTEMLDEIRKSEGYAEKVAKQRMDTLKGDWLILHDTMQAFAISFTEATTGPVRWFLQGLTKIVSKLDLFMRTPMGKALALMAVGFVVVITVAGAFLMILGGIKLTTIAARQLYQGFFKQLLIGWNASAAAASKYLQIQTMAAGGVSFIGKGGQMAVKGVKGFVTAGSAKPGILGQIIAFFTRLVSANTALGVFAKFITRFAGPIGGAIILLDAFIGLKNVIKAIIYAFGKFMHALLWVADLVIGLWNNPFRPDRAFEYANSRFKERGIKLAENLGFDLPESMTRNRGSGWGRTRDAKGNEIWDAERKKWDKTYPKDSIDARTSSGIPYIQNYVSIDGQKLTDILQDKEYKFGGGSNLIAN